MKRFAIHDWKALLYKTPEELDDALSLFGVKGKEIKEIHTIGMASNMNTWQYTHAMTTALTDVGIPLETIRTGAYTGIDATLLPCEVEICEPVVFVFADDSTLEVMPNGREGLLMSVNRIPIDVVDGLNYRNYDSVRFFERVVGNTIERIQTIRRRTTSQSGTSYQEERNSVTFQFWLKTNYYDRDYGVFFRCSYKGRYTFGMTRQNWFLDLGNATATVPFSKIKEVAYGTKQIGISEGYSDGGYFSIRPIRIVERSEACWDGVQSCPDEGISIDEDVVVDFLWYFLEKHFDPTFPYGDLRETEGPPAFEWNLDENIYTYETMHAMLSDIERHCDLLENDYDNAELTTLKNGFPDYAEYLDDNRSSRELSDWEKAGILRENIWFFIDFYRRFVKRMRSMLEYASDYDLISFMGP